MKNRRRYNRRRYNRYFLIIVIIMLLIIGSVAVYYTFSSKDSEYRTYNGEIVVENNYKTPIVIQVLKDMLGSGQDETFEEGDEAAEEEVNDWDGVTLQYNPDTKKGYLRNCVFLGDSRTVAMVNYAFINDDDALAQIGISHMQFSNNTFTNNAGNSYTLKSYLASHQKPVVYLALGVNGMYGIDETDYEMAYDKLVNTIISLAPNSNLVIMSIGPANDNGIYKKTVQNAWIDRYNDFLYGLAKEKGLYYLDVNTVLKNDAGQVKAEYDAGDGLHYKSAAYDAIMDYIIHHPVPGVSDEGEYTVRYIKPRVENTQMPMDETQGDSTTENAGSEENTDEGAAENTEEAEGESLQNTEADGDMDADIRETVDSAESEAGTDKAEDKEEQADDEQQADMEALLQQLNQQISQ